MNQQVRGAAGGLAVAALLALSACGTPTTAAGPLETLAKLDTPNYVTVPPVTTPPTTAPAAGAAAAAATTVGETTHTVAANESLGIIAGKYGIKVEDLVAFNGFTSAQHVIHPGQTIKIPAGATVPGASASSGAASSASGATASGSTTTTTAAAGAGCTYKTVAKDNPGKVAKKFGITVEQLKAANSADVYNSFLIGAEITIPPPGKC